MTEQELVTALNNWLKANGGTLTDGVSNAITDQQNKNEELAATLQRFVDQTSERANTSQDQYQATMNRLLDREERYGTGNPFIDAMEAYASYKKRKNPDYKFNGLMGAIDDWRDKRKESQPASVEGNGDGGQTIFQRIGGWWDRLTGGGNAVSQPSLNAQAGDVNPSAVPISRSTAQDFSGLLSFMSSPQRVAALTSGLGAMTQLRDRPGSMPQHNKSAGTAPRSVYPGVSLNDMWGGIVKDMYDDSGKLRGGTGPLAGTWEDFLDQSKWRGKGNIDTYKGYGTNKTNWSNALIRNNTRDLYNKMVDEYFNWSGGGGR